MAAAWVVPASVTTAADGPPPVDLVSGGNTDVTIAYAFVVEAGITEVTVNWAAASKTNSVNVMEWSGLSGTINAQKHGGGGAAVTPQVATTLTTTNANTLVIAAIQANATTAAFASASASPTTGWNVLTGGAEGSNHMAAEYNIATGTGAFGGAWTMGVAATAGMVGLAFDYGTTPVLVHQTEQDNASGPIAHTVKIPATTAGNTLIVIVGQAAASTAVGFRLSDNGSAPVVVPRPWIPKLQLFSKGLPFPPFAQPAVQSTTTATVYNDSGTGTITLSGSSSESASFADSRTGTITLSGSGTQSLTTADSRSGTITLSGTGTQSLTTSDSRSGTVTLSGTSTQSLTTADSRSGTVTLSGTGIEQFGRIFNDSASGTITLSGSGTGSQLNADSGSVTLTLSGSGTQSLAASDSRSGTITLSGSGVENFQPPGGGATGIDNKLLVDPNASQHILTGVR